MSELPIGFDPVLYLRANPDLAQTELDAVRHYLEYGQKEGRLLAPVATGFLPPAAGRDPGAENFTFDPAYLELLAREIGPGYTRASPFPYAIIENFLPDIVARRILAEFPPKESTLWLDWKIRDPVHQPKKQGIGNAYRMDGAPLFIQHMLFAFNSFPIIHFLEQVTGIAGLIPDPDYDGGGLHQILSGGKLAIHADFNFHKRMRVYRRINLLLYFNDDWSADYGGDLELWDPELTRCAKRIAPLFNRCVIFNTGRTSYHGHPHPLNTPEHITRKSFALYYYTSEPPTEGAEKRDTNWHDTDESR